MRRTRSGWVVLGALGMSLFGAAALADPSPFDLAGPELRVEVTRGGTTLPIAEVPNLAPGDRLSIQAELPPDQSEHYLLVTAFLRGATNPPPKEWFYRCETWSGPCAAHGQTLTVPATAQQVLVFLAPETGGDFRTLVGAVRGRPGAFVRASQDLNQAALDRSRLDTYLAAVRKLDGADRSRLKEAAPLLARSLAIKVDEKCLTRIPELQAPCLMDGGDSLILNDGHSTSIVEALTSGPAADLAMEASYTPKLSYGYYSPYVASVLDIARIMSSFDSAQYQYIPALARPHGDRLSLALNTPPSFHDPKSVLVAALPAVEPTQLPPLHAVDPKGLYCARKTSLVLPVEGAPLAFSTGFARDLHVSLSGGSGQAVDLPAKADPEAGGILVDTSGLARVTLGESVRAALVGYWGFDAYRGPSFQLMSPVASGWSIPADEDGALVVGRIDTLHLQARDTSCLKELLVRDSAGNDLKPEWKAVHADDLEVKLPLQNARPGPLTLLVHQYGSADAQPVALQAFADAPHLESFVLHAGDSQGVLKGTRLDQVASMTLKGIDFAPGNFAATKAGDELTLVAAAPALTTGLKPGEGIRVKVKLKDGRTLGLDTQVAAHRPSVTLLNASIQASEANLASSLRLSDARDLPQDARLRFAVRTEFPATFARDETIDVATSDETFSVSLGLGAGVTLENAKVALVTLDPQHAFGASAAGPLKFRATVDGVSGDWQPLVTLVRLPEVTDLLCPTTADLACKLSGANLFLIDSIASDATFGHSIEVPDGFPGDSLPVPHPVDGKLYVKLRDDPSVIDSAVLPVRIQAPVAGTNARVAARQAAVTSDHAMQDQPLGGSGPPETGAPPHASMAPSPPGPEPHGSAPVAAATAPTSQPVPAPVVAGPGNPTSTRPDAAPMSAQRSGSPN